jgi:hypothetical protein
VRSPEDPIRETATFNNELKSFCEGGNVGEQAFQLAGAGQSRRPPARISPCAPNPVRTERVRLPGPVGIGLVAVLVWLLLDLLLPCDVEWRTTERAPDRIAREITHAVGSLG